MVSKFQSRPTPEQEWLRRDLASHFCFTRAWCIRRLFSLILMSDYLRISLSKLSKSKYKKKQKKQARSLTRRSCSNRCTNNMICVSVGRSVGRSIHRIVFVSFWAICGGTRNRLRKGFSSIRRWMTQKMRGKKHTHTKNHQKRDSSSSSNKSKEPITDRHGKLYALIDWCEWPEIDRLQQSKERNTHANTNQKERKKNGKLA